MVSIASVREVLRVGVSGVRGASWVFWPENELYRSLRGVNDGSIGISSALGPGKHPGAVKQRDRQNVIYSRIQSIYTGLCGELQLELR